MGAVTKFTLCWDCKNATGGCSWADSLKPVKGWKAEKLHKIDSGGTEYTTYWVNKCPKFTRDAIGFGQAWKEA